jgi:hypothetical protein
MLGKTDGGTKLERGLAQILSEASETRFHVVPEIGWAATDRLLPTRFPVGTGEFDVLVTSASAELSDPSENSLQALEGLSRSIRERYDAHLVVLNGSSLATSPPMPARSRFGVIGRLDLEIRRLNLTIMEASSATGLSVLDADRLIAETRSTGKVLGPFDYAPHACETIQSSLASVLGELGLAARSALEIRAPFVRQADLTIGQWCKAEGERIAKGEIVCELRVAGLRKMTRQTNALVLGAINGAVPLVRRLVPYERVRQRRGDRRMNAVLPLVAAQTGVLRKVLLPTGSTIHPGAALAILTSDGDTPIDDVHRGRAVFRAVVKTDDPFLEAIL